MLEKMKSFKKIDAHSHVGYFGGWSDVGITPEELIAQMDEYNVEKTVISTYPIKESIEAVDKYPDRLVGAAWVNPNDAAALDQISDAVKNHGFKAIKLHPLFHSYMPNEECEFPIAKLAHDLYIPLMIHTGRNRIMWGSDAPFHHPTVEMQRTIVSGLTDEQLEDVFYNNVKELLKL